MTSRWLGRLFGWLRLEREPWSVAGRQALRRLRAELSTAGLGDASGELASLVAEGREADGRTRDGNPQPFRLASLLLLLLAHSVAAASLGLDDSARLCVVLLFLVLVAVHGLHLGLFLRGRWRWAWLLRAWDDALATAKALQTEVREALRTLREREVMANGYALSRGGRLGGALDLAKAPAPQLSCAGLRAELCLAYRQSVPQLRELMAGLVGEGGLGLSEDAEGSLVGLMAWEDLDPVFCPHKEETSAEDLGLEVLRAQSSMRELLLSETLRLVAAAAEASVDSGGPRAGLPERLLSLSLETEALAERLHLANAHAQARIHPQPAPRRPEPTETQHLAALRSLRTHLSLLDTELDKLEDKAPEAWDLTSLCASFSASSSCLQELEILRSRACGETEVEKSEMGTQASSEDFGPPPQPAPRTLIPADFRPPPPEHRVLEGVAEAGAAEEGPSQWPGEEAAPQGRGQVLAELRSVLHRRTEGVREDELAALARARGLALHQARELLRRELPLDSLPEDAEEPSAQPSPPKPKPRRVYQQPAREEEPPEPVGRLPAGLDFAALLAARGAEEQGQQFVGEGERSESEQESDA